MQATIQVTAAHNIQLLPDVAWNGTQYVVTYEDYRNIEILWDKPVSDIFATRLSALGSVLDPDGFPIAANARA